MSVGKYLLRGIPQATGAHIHFPGTHCICQGSYLLENFVQSQQKNDGKVTLSILVSV